jgi:DNA polymerase-3 subunit beta
MEFVVRKADLLKELQLLQGIVERKNTIPILANVHLDARDDVVRFLVTDLEVGLRTQCAASVARPGAATAPAKKLFEIVRALPDADVRIEEEGRRLRIAADRFDSHLQTLPPEDFPSLPAPPETETAALPQSVLREMAAKTGFAITGEDARYYLNGALFALGPKTARMVSTDGHRLALMSVDRADGPAGNGEVSAILPKKTLDELGRLAAEAGEAEQMHYSRGENHLFFSIGQRVLMSRVIDGQFPNFERVIPKNNDKRIEFERERLSNAVRRVSLLSSERSRAVKFAAGPGKVEISSQSAEFGDACEPLTVDYDGGPVQICFNAKYVSDFLNAVSAESVSLELKDDVSPALFRPVGVKDYDYTYVIMPIRI